MNVRQQIIQPTENEMLYQRQLANTTEELILTPRQELLLEYVKDQHGEQKRKYTNELYWTHPLAVAEIVDKHEEDCIEAALCHDLFEDTQCTYELLFNALHRYNFSWQESIDICELVSELTDIYTPEKFPELNRSVRKAREAKRLSNISSKAQSIKYADLIHNTESIVSQDPKFATTYFYEKAVILSLMREGNKDLLRIAELNIEMYENI